MMKSLKIKTLQELENILSLLNTEEYSLINYVWLEYGFYPIFFNELFVDFYRESKGPRIGICFEGHEIFYENHVDILITLENFIDTKKTYVDNTETKLLLDNFSKIPDRGIAFWYTLRNFDEDLYWEVISKFKFRNILYPIGKEIPWQNGLFGLQPGFKYAEGIDGTWFLPHTKYHETGKLNFDLSLWKKYFNNFKKEKSLDIKNYNTFFVKNTWKTRSYSSTNIDDLIVGTKGTLGNGGFGFVNYEFFLEVVDYHIKNKINLVIINDLVRFPKIENEYITYLDMVGFLDVRLLLTIVDESDNFICTATSSADLAGYYCNTNLVVINDTINRTEFLKEVQQIKNKKILIYDTNSKDYQTLFSFLEDKV